MNELSLTVTKKIKAPIDSVFNAWLNPKLLSQFILPMPGMPEPVVDNNPIIGGKFTILMQVGENKIPHTGEYIEIERPNKLVFTWQSPFSADGSIVTIIFKELNDNITHVELTHIKFIDEEARNNHTGGWTNILNCLEGLVSSIN